MHFLVVSAATIDLSPILTPLIQIAGLILMGLAGWGVKKILDLLHIGKESTLRATLLDAVDRGITFAQNQATLAANGAQVPVTNSTVATAANYVISKFPGTISALGLTNQHVADMVIAKLPLT